MNTLKQCSLYLLLTLLVFACAPPKPKKELKNVYQALFQPEKKGFFRGFEMSNLPGKVKEDEQGLIVQESDTLLAFQSILSLTDDTIQLNHYYAFDSYGLFEVQVDMYPNKDGRLPHYLAQLDSGLTVAYGRSKRIGNTRTWTTVSVSNNIIEITLGTEQDDNDPAFLSLNFLEPLDDAI